MKLTLEALYLLQLFNDHSDDLSFLPLPLLKGEGRKEALVRAIEKGYEDLREVGLIDESGDPTEECAEYGYLLKEYHESAYHYQIDQDYFCAPAIDDDKWMTVILTRDEDGLFMLDRIPSSLFLVVLIHNHEFLQHLDTTVKDYLHSDFDVEPLISLLVHHGQTEALRIAVEEAGHYTQNFVYYINNNSIFEYDMTQQRQRSIDSSELKHLIFRKMKVEV